MILDGRRSSDTLGVASWDVLTASTNLGSTVATATAFVASLSERCETDNCDSNYLRIVSPSFNGSLLSCPLVVNPVSTRMLRWIADLIHVFSYS